MPKDNNTIKLLPNFNPHRDTAGFQLIPKDFDQMHLSDSNTLPEDFVPYQKAPQILKKVEPVYPKSGIRGALEGKVFVKILVGTDGKTKQVSVMKSDAEIFKKPAVAAAKQFVFAPAYMNNEPVAAWLTYQFQFKAPKRK